MQVCCGCRNGARPLGGGMGLTGTWLDKGKLPGLFFLLLLLLLVPPPPLMVLPPDILRFRRLFGGCLDGSAAEENGCRWVRGPGDTTTPAWGRFLPGGATILCHFWKRQVLRQSLGLRLYVLCRDISSCIGSKITHSWWENQRGNVTGGGGSQTPAWLTWTLLSYRYIRYIFI